MKHIKQIEPYFDNEELKFVSQTLKSKFITEGKETYKFEKLVKHRLIELYNGTITKRKQ